MRRISSNSESGAILLIVIILMLALTITGIAFLNAGVMENSLVRREVHKNQAFYLADGGIEHLLVKLKAGEKTDDWNQPAGEEYWVPIPATLLGKGDYWVHYYVDNPPYAISTGRVEGILKKIKVEIYQKSIFDYGVFGDEWVRLKGTPEVSSYHSGGALWPDGSPWPDDKAKVGTNGTHVGAIELIGSAVLKGDALVGPNVEAESVILAPEGAVTGEKGNLEHIELEEVFVPDDLAGLDDGSLTISGGMDPVLLSNEISGAIGNGDEDSVTYGKYIGSFSSIKVTGSELIIDVPCVLAVHELTIMGNGIIRINPGVDVILYVTGETILLAGGSIVNENADPTTLHIFGTNSCHSIQLAGTTDFYGAIYAPNADIVCTGTANIYGSIVGKTVELPGTTNFYCDGALMDDPYAPKITNFKNWQEIS